MTFDIEMPVSIPKNRRNAQAELDNQHILIDNPIHFIENAAFPNFNHLFPPNSTSMHASSVEQLNLFSDIVQIQLENAGTISMFSFTQNINSEKFKIILDPYL